MWSNLILCRQSAAGLLHAQKSPVLDFLAPSLVGFSAGRRHASPTPATGEQTQSRKRPLSQKQRDFLDGALRVNHAGELAATLIYAAQTPLICRSHPQLGPLMKRMYDQEAGHFRTFSNILAKHRIRPTALYPIWKVAATTLGWTTAMMGREAAMACTEAVETEIGEHYNGQVRALLQMLKELEEQGDEPDDELKELLIHIRRIRDEELEHLDHALENDAKQAEGHELLTNVIRGGCRAAIWLSERI